MPQMAPMNWLSLFISFSILLLMINSMNFFSTMNKSPETSTNKINKPTNWKW
uniref:ATP synthase complex subunit 8 n=1 Tax=Trogoderma granarium TaxID=591392 RepID=A0A5H2V283_9COLE